MHLYYLLIRIAAFFGHHKAQKLVAGQAQCMAQIQKYAATLASGEQVTWIHVASVGEFEQARPIIEHADNGLGKIVLTFFSPSGYELRKNYAAVDGVFYLPFPTRRNAKQFLDTLPVRRAIFVKYEFWPAYLKQLQKRAIPTTLVSAIFRPNQLFFQPWGGWYRQLLHCFTHIFVQDDASMQLLNKYGIDSVEVAGDTRFDRVLEVKQQAKNLPVLESFTQGKSKILIAGSTWLEDEKLLARYWWTHDDITMVLVPHEIGEQHLHQIFPLFEGRYIRYSEYKPIHEHSCRLLVVDTIGVLSSIYRYGQVAYVGGGFGDGIHNTLEPAVYGMPVVFGPKWHRFREAKGLLQADAARCINNYAQLEKALDAAFARQTEMGENAYQYVQSQVGATQTIVSYLRG